MSPLPVAHVRICWHNIGVVKLNLWIYKITIDSKEFTIEQAIQMYIKLSGQNKPEDQVFIQRLGDAIKPINYSMVI